MPESRNSTVALLFAAASLLACGFQANSTELSAEADVDPGRSSGAKIEIAKETTYLTEPLRPGGGIDYLEAVNQLASEGVTVENNAVVPLVQALGPGLFRDEAARKTFFGKLGIPIPPEQGRYFLNENQFAERVAGQDYLAYLKGLSDEYEEARSKPWSREQLPKVAAWLDYNRKPLQAVLEATRRPSYYFPLIDAPDRGSERLLMSVRLPIPQASRAIARALRARVMLAVGEGRIDDALEDLLACHRLARLIADGRTLIEGLVGLSIESTACVAGTAMLRSDRSSGAQLRKYQQALAQLSPVWSAADSINRDQRFEALDTVTHVAHHGLGRLETFIKAFGPGDELNLASLETVIGGTDWNLVLRAINDEFDRLHSIAAKPRYSERRMAIDNYGRHLSTLGASLPRRLKEFDAADEIDTKRASKFTADFFATVLVTGVLHARNAEDRAVMRLRLLRLATHLERFHQTIGRFPEKLDELDLGNERELAVDLFTDKPIIYRRTESGYLVYSVGLNQQDDGGRVRHANPPADDIVVRMNLDQ